MKPLILRGMQPLSRYIYRRLQQGEAEGRWAAILNRIWPAARRIGHRLLRRQPPLLLVLDGPPRLSGFAAITGWAAARHGPVTWIEALVENNVIAAGPPVEHRPDVLERFPSFRFQGPAGFRLAPPVGFLPDGRHELLLRAYDDRGRTSELRTILEVDDYRIADDNDLPTHLRGSNREYQVWSGWHALSLRRAWPQPPTPFEDSGRATRGGQPVPHRFSVVMPIYRPNPEHLREAIDSVRAQSHPRWELSLCDDGSESAELTRYLQGLAEADGRIQLVTHMHNRGIAEATNTAIRLGAGDYVGFLDQDDRLAPDALEVIAQALDRSPADWLYSDEDRIDEHGCRVEPFFKPDWSPDLLLSMMYTAHLSVYRREFLGEIGLCRSEFDGGQDWELALRAASRTSRIVHVPKVLYHWRLGGHSAGTRFNRVCHERGRRAIREFLERQRVRAEVADGPNGCTFHVRYRHEREPLVSILIPTRDNLELLRRCLRSVCRRTDYENYEIIVIDNGSRELRTLRFLRSWEGEAPAEPPFPMHGKARREPRPPSHRVVRFDMPFNHSLLNNLAAREARGELLLLLNDDTEVINHGWLTAMVEQALRPEVGAVGACLYHSDERIQHAGVVVGLGPVATPLHGGITRDGLDRGMVRLIRNISAVTGACLMMRKQLYHEVGGLDEKHLPTSFNDVDLCLRLREAGYRNIGTPLARLYHRESASRDLSDEERFIRLMHERWGEALQRDPFWNPNLPHGPRPHQGFAFNWSGVGETRDSNAAARRRPTPAA
jgi:GT2 family glycosyltransferase